jgi:uncharacterized phage-associated protein
MSGHGGLRESRALVKIEAMPNAEEIMGHDTTSLTAIDVADYFIGTADYDSGDNITNLKLQKLLYYAQGFHVAMHDGQPLFSESVLAWKHGPVVKRVYSLYSHYKHRSIDQNSGFRADAYAPEDRELLEAVYSTYGQYGATKLENMTHEESPWLKTPRNRAISLELLADYFAPLVQAGRRGKAVEGRPLWPATSFRYQRRKELSKRMAEYRPRLKAMACRGPVDAD